MVAAVLEGEIEVHRALGRQRRLVTSSLTFGECWRAFVRARTSGRLTEEGELQARHALQSLLLECVVVPVSDDILERAGRPFPVEPVRTLDAIHLASIQWLSLPVEDVIVVTRDRRVRENAAALGYTVV
ncbi:MAG: Ribonuclease VapC [Gemmatimonadetes bacterium]|nr:Ribonuclease VapC [Gemmatimonadota bacterium]